MDPIAHAAATTLARKLRRREIGCRELLDHYLARVERLNPSLNAVVTLDVERARRRADAADAALARGEVTGPLHGLPMTIKDSYETVGLRTTCGFPPLTDHVPAADAVGVARLVAAGAVVFGKTNTPALAADVQTYNPLFGVTRNPWDPTRTAGGSSGGAAAAVAAGLTALEFGSDIGGSIRTPSSWCGVYGHKPTHGIIPQRGHISPGPPGTLSEVDLCVMGPIGRSADDLAVALDILAGPLPDRAVAWRLELPAPRRASLRDYRVAAWLDDAACPVDGQVRARLEAAVEALRKAGCRVDDRARPAFALRDVVRSYLRLLMPVMLAGFPDEEFDRLVESAVAFPPDDDSFVAHTLRSGTARHRDWLRADEERARLRAACDVFFRDHDVLLCPVTPAAAIPHDHSEPLAARTIVVNGASTPYGNLFSWIALATAAWLPATVAPVGRTPEGLPVGVQIVGPYLEDRTSIEVARRLADVVGGFDAPPGS